MQQSPRASKTFTAAWLLLAAALCVLVALWGIQISTALGPAVDTVAAISPSPVPSHALVAPHIVTDYTTDHTGDASRLCAELSPASATVQVETPTGDLISTLHCPSK
jgi:hypothetical protein